MHMALMMFMACMTSVLLSFQMEIQFTASAAHRTYNSGAAECICI